MKRAKRFIQIELRRVRNLRQFSRGPRYSVQSPSMGLWASLLVICVGTLIGLGEIVGRSSATGTHHRFWSALEKTAQQPSVALPLSFAILATAAYSIRRLRLETLAWLPGQIQVPDFTVQGLENVSGAQLTSCFRDRLACMRLASAGATPATQPVSNFIDVLGATHTGSSGIVATLLGLLKAAAPDYAYEIRGVVAQSDDSSRPYRISLQLLRLPHQGGMQITVTNEKLENAIQAAADHATAAILPRTRLCRGPWVAWRRYKMPGELFNAYEEACELEANGDHIQALERYYQALEHDPMNWSLRLQLGQLQEKKQMSLEALATYTALIKTAEPKRRRLSAGLYTRGAERERERAFLIARYRRAVLLLDSNTAKDWQRAESPRKRTRRTSTLRNQLEQLFLDELFKAINAAREEASKDRSLTDVLSDSAKREISLLLRELPISWKLARRPPLTARALELTLLCIDERAKHSRASRTPAELKRRISNVERVWKLPPRSFRRWKEHYNVACLFAIPLLDKKMPPGLADEYAKHAVGRLELAAACATSSYVASQHDWIKCDPDLAGLRKHATFKAFEAGCFPTPPAT